MQNLYSCCCGEETSKEVDRYIFIDKDTLKKKGKRIPSVLLIFEDEDILESEKEACKKAIQDICYLVSMRMSEEFQYVANTKSTLYRKFNWTPREISRLDLLRRGSYGNTFTARHKQNESAVTVLKVVSMKYEEDCFLEMKHWTKISGNPYITCFIGCFMNQYRIGVLSEYNEGVSLYYYIRKFGIIPFNTAAIITAQVSSAVIFIHQKDIFHRNINTTNIKLCTNGLSKIGEFHKAVQNKHNKAMKGVWQYCAPEALEQKFYNNKVSDWYSVGVCLYEMVIGLTPLDFYCRMESIEFGRLDKTGQRVVSIEMKIYLPHNMEKPLQSTIKHFLEKRPSRRLGYSDDISQFKKEPFFKEINWKLLKSGELKLELRKAICSILDTYIRYESRRFYLS